MSSIPEALSIALKHLQAGRSAAAEQICQEIIRQVPSHADAWHLLGLVHSEQGRNDLALDCLQRAAVLSPCSALLQHNLGLVYRALRRLDEAAACYRRALELRPDDAGTHCDLGLVLKEQGQLDEAVTCYRQAVELDPELAEAHNNLANILQDQGQADAAVASYRRAAQLRPTSADVHRNLGLALRDHGQWDEAIACFRRVVELRPEDAETYKDLGFALESRGHWDEAMTCYRRVLDLKPDSPEGKVHHSLGLEYLARGRPAEALEVWRHWLKADPSAPIARHLLAAATGQDVPARANDDYVRGTFDVFALTFDRQLQELDYRVPALIATAVDEALGGPAGRLDVLDAGCGTGLCGPLLRPYARRLTGIDLSPAMLDRARARQVYDDLIRGELTAHLQSVQEHYDLIAFADTLVYFGDLQPVLAAAAAALRLSGWLVFSLEEQNDDGPARPGYRLQYHGRYAHAADYVRQLLAETGFHVRTVTFATLRAELGRPVAGMVVSACRGDV